MASHAVTLDRRGFIGGAATAAASALIIPIVLDGAPASAAMSALLPLGLQPAPGTPVGPYIKIDTHNVVTVVIGPTEMGQGIMSGLAQLVAAELRLDWTKVQAEHSVTTAGNAAATPIRCSAPRSRAGAPVCEAGTRRRVRQRRRRARCWCRRPRSFSGEHGGSRVADASSAAACINTSTRLLQQRPSSKSGRTGSRGSRRFDWSTACAVGYSCEGQRHGRLRHRCCSAEDGLRDVGPLPDADRYRWGQCLRHPRA